MFNITDQFRVGIHNMCPHLEASKPEDYGGITLRLSISKSDNGILVICSLEMSGRVTCNPPTIISLPSIDWEERDLRWYLEDFPHYPEEPSPTIAAQIEQSIAETGEKLFESIFMATKDGVMLWNQIRECLEDTRIEIASDEDISAFPWEILKAPELDAPLALFSRAFVRVNSQGTPDIPFRRSNQSPIRVLLVISRPAGAEDVPFRSVAKHIVASLTADTTNFFHVEVLRPPTFSQLEASVKKAKSVNRPYHILHFDGHGEYRDLYSQNSVTGKSRGYVIFGNSQYVHGQQIGKLMVENDVPILVLNACRSAHAEPIADPSNHDKSENEHRPAFGSFAQEVINQGVAGVVAMRFNVFVPTAATFLTRLYLEVSKGAVLSEAVTHGRKHLAANPYREISQPPVSLQDWLVPVVFESTPLRLVPDEPQTRTTVESDTKDAQPFPVQAIDFPFAPKAGFWGRDETFLALEREFESRNIVLLHALAGAGKTTAATEFARWYAQTGGINGPLLFTSFARYQPLSRVLDVIGRVFSSVLARRNPPIDWLVLNNAQRRSAALEIFKEVPVFWVWDNVESVTQSSEITRDLWTTEMKTELKEFLKDCQDTKAVFLITSRTDELAWLGDLMQPIKLPPLRMLECVQLARGIALRRDAQLMEAQQLWALLRFAAGNPLATTVIIGLALKDNLRTRDDIDLLLKKLQMGEVEFGVDSNDGVNTSLHSSLVYALTNTFDSAERRQFALLHFFRDFIDVNVLRQMGSLQMSTTDVSVDELRHLSRDGGMYLLDKGCSVGLLNSYGGGYYSIHPFVPGFLKAYFDDYYGDGIGDSQIASTLEGRPKDRRLSVTRAFVEAVVCLANSHIERNRDGYRNVVADIRPEEQNLLHALKVARTNDWRDLSIGIVQCLRILYQFGGRMPEWKSLLREVTGDFVEASTGEAKVGCEDSCYLITQLNAQVAAGSRDWSAAEHLQRKCVIWSMRRAAPYTDEDTAFSEAARNAIYNLAASMKDLGHTLCEQQNPEGLDLLEQSFGFAMRAGARTGAAVTAQKIAVAYRQDGALQDLDKAEKWCKEGLKVALKDNDAVRADCLGELGVIYYRRFQGGLAGNETHLHEYLTKSIQFLRMALNLISPHNARELAVVHGHLANCFASVGKIDEALPHYHESIRNAELIGDDYKAAITRGLAARALVNNSRFTSALLYAESALRELEKHGSRAENEILGVLETIALVRQNQQ